MILYRKIIPSRKATKKFVARVRHQVNETDQIEIESEDIELSKYSHQDCTAASETTSSKLE